MKQKSCNGQQGNCNHPPKLPVELRLRNDSRWVGGLACGGSGTHPLKLAGKIGGALPAVVGVFREALLHDALQCYGRKRLELRDGRGLGGEDRSNQAGPAGSGKGWLPCRHFVEHFAEGKDIRARIRRLSLQLLGGHVLEGADDHASAGELGLLLRHLGERIGERCGTGLHGEAEVEQLRAGLRQHDVRGLQIAMGNAQLVCFGQGVGNLRTVANRLLGWQRAFFQTAFQGLAVQKFHDEKIHAVLVADVVQRADVGMGELGNRFGLPLQALLQRRIGGKAGKQNLDGNRAVEPRVVGAIDFAHAAA